MAIYLDLNDRDKELTDVEALFTTNKAGTLRRAGLYAVLSTICVGKNASDYVVTNFKMQYDLLKYVFDDVQYNALGITEANNNLFVYKPPVKAPPAIPKAASRSKTSTLTKIKKSSGAKAFMGKRFRFRIPTAKAGLLYPSGFLKAKPRKAATMLFPNIATNDQVACWFSTHQTPGGANVVRIVSEKGTGIIIPSGLTTAEHDANIGKFDLATKARLDGTKVGKELDPA